jgi:hypothetical protein
MEGVGIQGAEKSIWNQVGGRNCKINRHYIYFLLDVIGVTNQGIFQRWRICLMEQRENAYKTLKTNLNERDHL